MAAHKLTLKQRHELKRLYKEGARDIDLAEWFGVSEATVRGHTKEFRRKHPLRTFDHDRAHMLWKEQGLTKEAIAQRFGLDARAVGKAILRIERSAA